MQEALVVRRETHIPAPPAAVFAFLTDSGGTGTEQNEAANAVPETCAAGGKGGRRSRRQPATGFPSASNLWMWPSKGARCSTSPVLLVVMPLSRTMRGWAAPIST